MQILQGLVTDGTQWQRMEPVEFVRYGTVLQKDVWTRPHLSSECHAFLWVYNHVLLKTCNEAVVEGMCKFISRQADFVRGLDFERYKTYM